MSTVLQPELPVAARTGTEAPPVAAELAAGVDRVTYLTIPNVEILTAGMNWNAATGDVTYTLEHLADAVTAAMEDPHILLPRLRIGHFDPRFNEEPHTWDPFAYQGELREDGNPVFGKVANLRLVNDGAVIVGDYIEMPDWLACAAPSAFPSRSQENTWNIEAAANVQTQGGKRYSCVITSVSLLGEAMPAITDLEDLVRLLTGGPAAVTARAEAPAATSTRRSTAMPAPAAATASVDAVVESFWNLAQGDMVWWWCRELWLDAGQVIADDDDGHLFRVPFTADADGNVTWADPVRVLDFRDLPAAASQSTSTEPDRVYVTAAQARPKDRVRPVAATVDQGGTMNDEQKQLAVKLGLGEDATVEQLNEKLQADALAAAPESTEETTTEEVSETTTETAEEQEPVAATVTVSRDVWEQTNGRLSTLEERDRAREEAATTARRDTVVASALSEGRITPSEHNHYRSILDVDEEKTTKLLATLAAGRVPVAERGTAPSALSDGVDASWFPQFTTTKKETVNG